MEIEPFECFTAVPGRLAEGMVDVEAVNKEDDAVHRVTDAKKPPGRSPEGPGRPGGHARGDIESIHMFSINRCQSGTYDNLLHKTQLHNDLRDSGPFKHSLGYPTPGRIMR